LSTKDHPDWWRPVGGQNSQDSTLERRSMVWNDNEIETPTVPPHTHIGIDDRGKFFPRGMRGKIEEIQLYCTGNGAATVDLVLTPHPGLGPFYTLVLTPAAGWAWQGVALEEMWNYDSLFIWIRDCDGAITWGGDGELPFDGHTSPDGGATWASVQHRPFIRVVYSGETPGDVPVSGTINTIEVPSTASRAETEAAVNVPHAVQTEVVEIEGAGILLEASLTFGTSVTPTPGDAPGAVIYGISFIADGAIVYYASNRMLTQSYVAVSGRCAVGEFYQGTVEDPPWDETELTLRLPIKFRRSLVLRAWQSTGAAVDVHAVIVANMNT